ncbi:MAG: IS3 family transposase [Pseudobdellovibrio sp.]
MLENELLKDRYFKTYGEAYASVFRFIKFYNERRIHGSIGNISPDRSSFL